MGSAPRRDAACSTGGTCDRSARARARPGRRHAGGARDCAPAARARRARRHCLLRDACERHAHPGGRGACRAARSARGVRCLCGRHRRVARAPATSRCAAASVRSKRCAHAATRSPRVEPSPPSHRRPRSRSRDRSSSRSTGPRRWESSHRARSRSRRPSEVLAGADELGYPLVVKPLASWRALPGGGGETVAPMLAYDRAALEKVAHRLVRPDAPALLQQVATGVRETHKFVLQDGRMIARLVMVAERCWPPLGGSSVMRVTIEPPADSYALALALVTDVGLRGRLRGGVPPRRRRPPAADGDQRAHLPIGRPGAPRRRRARRACSCAGRAASTSSRWPTTAAASASAGRPEKSASWPAA